MKSIKAIAIVKKDDPRLDLNDIYRPVDAKDIRIAKDEKMVEVIIKES